MQSTPFKTPYSTKKLKRLNSDSEESLGSDSGSVGTISSSNAGIGQLSIVALYDELQRQYQQRIEDRDDILGGFLHFAEQSKLFYEEYTRAITDCVRLRNEADQIIEERNESNRLLKNARKMLDEERKKRHLAENERDEFKYQIAKFCNILVKDNRNKLADEAKEQINNLYPGRISLGDADRLSAIREVNSTGSILSDFSYSRSEDDLDIPTVHRNSKEWSKRHTDREGEPATKKRKSYSFKTVEIEPTETVRATTTLTVNKEGPITAVSIVESVPKPEENYQVPPAIVIESWAKQTNEPHTPSQELNNNYRQHFFQQRVAVIPNECSVCKKNIRFGKTICKCKECKLSCHVECKGLMPLPCIPAMNTPSSKKFTGTVADYTPTTPPMVPSLIIHCVKEIEQRGLVEVGIYRVPGSEKEVKGLKEKFLNSRLPPNLKNVDIHAIAGCVKDFIRSFTEPLLTRKLWNDFIIAVRAKDTNDILPALYETISRLPQPNRDTLAFLIIHLQKVAESPECKMGIDNLAKIFGPTIVGYSSDDVAPERTLEETKGTIKVMTYLLNIPNDFWNNFLNIYSTPSTNRLQQTPSTDSLLKPTVNRCYTTPGGRTEGRFKKKREGKIFETPPTYR